MANNYYEGTGVLVLDHVTPVIKALFGAFRLDEHHPSNGQAYIAQIAETNNPRWTDVLDGLENLAAQLGIPMPDDEELSIPPLLERLAAHFGAGRIHAQKFGRQRLGRAAIHQRERRAALLQADFFRHIVFHQWAPDWENRLITNTPAIISAMPAIAAASSFWFIKNQPIREMPIMPTPDHKA